MTCGMSPARWGLLWLLCASWAGASGQEIQVSAQVDTSGHIYAGQRFTYAIVIDGYNAAGQVDLTPLAPYSPQSQGNQDVSQTSIRIINGRTSQQEVKRFVMSYSLVAGSPGAVTLPSVAVRIEGKTYHTDAVQVNILRPGTTDKLALEVDLADRQCWVGQPILMTIKLYIASDADVGRVEFSIPAFSDDRFLLEDPQTVDPRAKPARIAGNVAAYVSQSQVNRQGRDWVLVSFSKVLIPQQPGTIDLGATSANVALAVGRQRSTDPFADFGFFGSRAQYAQFAVTSAAVTLTVSPLPDQGKPPGFYGLVGRYTITSSASPTEVSVGDPITLTVRVGGNPYLKPIQWPALDQIPEMAASFKIPSERSSPAIDNGFKVFTQTLRASDDKVTRIPPIALAYFDPDKGAYVTAQTDPIPLKVSPTRVLTDADVGGRSSEPVNKEVEAIKQGLAANEEDPAALTDQAFSPAAALLSPGVLVLWLLPLGLLTGSASFKAITHTTPERQAARRRRQAAAKAIAQLKSLAAQGPQDRHQLLAAALRQFLGDRFDRPAGSLTATDGLHLVEQATGDRDLALRLQALVADCEAVRYASSQTPISDPQIQEAIDLVRAVDRRARP